MSRFVDHCLPILALCAGLFATSTFGQAPDEVLRVCSDPNNLPLSHRNGEGYENKIAAEIASDLGRRLEYTYFPQRMGFVRNTLRKQDPTSREYLCDLIIGVPARYELTLTTEPYMRSTYALVFVAKKGLERIEKPEDLLSLPKKDLKSMRIGIFEQSPGADWLLRNGLLAQAVAFAKQSGDPDMSSARIVEEQFAAGSIDAAIVWGPIAGHLIRKHTASPGLEAVPFARDPQIKFDYEISMGVRRGEKEWQATLNEWIATHRERIDEILISYDVPLVDEGGSLVSGFRTQGAAHAGGSRHQDPLQLGNLAPQ